MLIYTGYTMISCIFGRIASEILYGKNHKFLRLFFGYLFILFAAAALSFLAGARDLSVGKDTSGYVIDAFRLAAYDAFSAFSPVFNWITPFTQRVMWWIAHNIKNLFVYLFWLNLFYTLPVIYSLVILTKRFSWVGIFIFGVFLYAMSMNLVRQCMAMGPAAMALCFTIKKRPIHFIAFETLAVLIHPTALIFALIYPIYYYFTHKTTITLLMKSFLVFLAVLVLYFCLPYLFKILPLSDFYVEYTVLSEHPSGGFLTAYMLVFFVCWLILCIFIYYKKKLNPTAVFLMSLFSISIIFIAISLQYDWISRLGFYFWLAIPFIPQVVLKDVKDPKLRLVFIILFLASSLITGYLYNDVRNSDQASNYIFGPYFNMLTRS